jgi:Zn-dependent peptidase ImmA (M78 family)
MSFDDLPTTPRSDEEIERVALYCRLTSDSADEWAPQIMQLIERLASRVSRFAGLRIEERPDADLPDAEAVALVQQRIIQVRASVLADAKRQVPRARMTLAHELGHIALDHVGTPKYRKAGAINSANVAPYRSEERQARVFAAAFLMPRALVLKCRSPEEVAERMAVSLQAAYIRYEQVCVRNGPKKIPEDIAQEIEQLKKSVEASEKKLVPSKSSLRPDQIKKLVWELAPTHPDLPPDEYRCIDQRWVIRWSRFELAKPGGWWIEGERIIVWEDKKSS